MTACQKTLLDRVFLSIGEDGTITTSLTSVERSAAAALVAIVTTETHLPGVANAVLSKSRAGLALWRLGPESVNTASAVTTTCDALGRAVKRVDGASGVERTIGYDPVSGQAATEQSWGGATSFPAATDKTSTASTFYTAAEASPGRLKSRTTDGQATSFTYSPRGELSATWGASYPLKYDFDAAGRLWKLHTYRTDPGTTPAQWPVGDVTEWTYYPGTALLQRKKDATGNGALLLYDAAGRLQKRTWVRGVSATYTYNLADEVRGIDYSDTTPDVSYTRDNLGRLASVSDGAIPRAFSYAGGHLTAESQDSAGRGLLYTYDAAGRKAGYSLWSAAGWVTWGGWGREPATGRVSGVNAPAGWVGYGYAAGQSALQTTTFGAATTTRTPDALGRLKTVETKVGATLPSPLFKHAYLYDATGRRTKATQGNASYWSYAYNPRGELTTSGKSWSDNSAVANSQRVQYFDAIGNRIQAAVSGRYAGWSANALNQVTSRNYTTFNNTPGLPVTGEADPAAVVKVNGAAASRKANFFSGLVSGGAYSTGLWSAVSVEEKIGTAAPTVSSGSAWIEPALESFSYDADGNLTQDGRWSYTWDGENRLIKVETRPSGVPANLPVEKLVFRYDAQGRRTEKEAWKKVSGTYQKQRHYYFDYEGWNLIAERVAEPTTLQLRRSYHWGVDLSGSLQGAGGVGGLVMETDHSSAQGAGWSELGGATTSFLPSYDGNGNVMGLLNVSDPQTPRVEAEYEYGAFGEDLRASVRSNEARGNPFRFSTKYQDEETGLAYYGYRYYSPGLGRWLSKDPLGETGGVNLLAFVRNSPTSVFDVLGEWPEYVTVNSTDPAAGGAGVGDVGYPITGWDVTVSELEPVGQLSRFYVKKKHMTMTEATAGPYSKAHEDAHVNDIITQFDAYTKAINDWGQPRCPAKAECLRQVMKKDLVKHYYHAVATILVCELDLNMREPGGNHSGDLKKATQRKYEEYKLKRERFVKEINKQLKTCVESVN